MAAIELTYRAGKKLLLVALLTLLITPNILTSQAYTSQHIELPEAAIKNIRIGLQSGNYGLMKCCLFYAGKYKISEVSQDLLEIVKNSDDEEHCQIAIWSLYQIGDDSCCKKLQELLESHSSEKIRNYCQFLERIREYQKALANIN